MIKDKKTHPEFEPGVLLVKLKTDDDSVLKKFKEKKHVHTNAMKHFGDKGYHKIKTDDVEATLKELKGHKDIEWVNKNYSRTTQFIPNDPYFDGLWGIKRIGADAVWAAGNTGDQKIYIGIIDEGIMYFHDDLCGQVWTNPDETDENGIDEDNSGYADDVHGYDFFNKDATIFDGSGDNHGSHVSGTIAAKGGNGIGVIGVCPNATLISGKFLEDWGYDDDAILAFDYMIWLKVHKNLNIVALNNSWGGSPYDAALKDAITRAARANILVVCAAGNSGLDSDLNPMYPAAYDNDNIISVGALNWDDTPAWFSNYGATTVDLFAPGVGIKSTIPGTDISSQYADYGGTSMATPHVVGVVGLVAATMPAGTSYSIIKKAILDSITPIAALAGKCVTGGIVNARPFTNYQTPLQQERGCTIPKFDLIKPTPPQNLTALAGVNVVTLSWEAAVDNESGIKDYWAWYDNGNAAIQMIGDYWRKIGIGGLTADKEYTFWITATDKWGNMSVPSNLVKATPFADTQIPTTPGNVSLTSVDMDTILFTWSPSTDDAGIANYNIYWRKVSNSIWQKDKQISGSYFWEIDGLLPGTEYEGYLTATDFSNNESDPSPVVSTTTKGQPPSDIEPPSVPDGLNAITIEERRIVLTWNPSVDNIGVTGYNVFWKKKVDINYLQVTTPQTSYDFSGLTDSTIYDFYVTAFDDAGNVSGASAVKEITTLTPTPPPPTGDLKVTLSGSDKKLSWVIENAVNPLVELQRKNKAWSNFNTVLSGGTGFTSYSIPPKPNKVYYWRIKVTDMNKTVFSNEIML